MEDTIVKIKAMRLSVISVSSIGPELSKNLDGCLFISHFVRAMNSHKFSLLDTNGSLPNPSPHNQENINLSSDDNKLPILALCFSLIAISIVLVILIVLFVRHQKDHATKYNVEKQSNAKRINSQVIRLPW